jgi:hypothetical protein
MMPSSFSLVAWLEVSWESLLDRVGDFLHDCGAVLMFCEEIARQ